VDKDAHAPSADGGVIGRAGTFQAEIKHDWAFRFTRFNRAALRLCLDLASAYSAPDATIFINNGLHARFAGRGTVGFQDQRHGERAATVREFHDLSMNVYWSVIFVHLASSGDDAQCITPA